MSAKNSTPAFQVPSLPSVPIMHHELLTPNFLAGVHGSVATDYHPGSHRAIDISQVILQPLILSTSMCKVMLRAHHDEVNTSIVKTVPVIITMEHNN